MGRGDEWSHVSRVPVLRRLSSALVTLVVLVAGLMLTWVATRAAIDGEKQRAHAELQLLTADIQPVYSSPNLPATVPERRESLRGFVYGPFRAEDFFRSALAGSAGAAYVEVFDGDSPSAGTLLYRGGTAAPADSTVVTRRLLLAGHHWTLRVSTAAT